MLFQIRWSALGFVFSPWTFDGQVEKRSGLWCLSNDLCMQMIWCIDGESDWGGKLLNPQMYTCPFGDSTPPLWDLNFTEAGLWHNSRANSLATRSPAFCLCDPASLVPDCFSVGSNVWTQRIPGVLPSVLQGRNLLPSLTSVSHFLFPEAKSATLPLVEGDFGHWWETEVSYHPQPRMLCPLQQTTCLLHQSYSWETSPQWQTWVPGCSSMLRKEVSPFVSNILWFPQGKGHRNSCCGTMVLYPIKIGHL